jgi:hypothetical protein
MNAQGQAAGHARHAATSSPRGCRASNRVIGAATWRCWCASAYDYPLIRELSTSPDATRRARRRERQFHNTNGLGAATAAWGRSCLQKTGYIAEAGRCVVMQAQDRRPAPDHGPPRLDRAATPASATPSGCVRGSRTGAAGQGEAAGSGARY